MIIIRLNVYIIYVTWLCISNIDMKLSFLVLFLFLFLFFLFLPIKPIDDKFAVRILTNQVPFISANPPFTYELENFLMLQCFN